MAQLAKGNLALGVGLMTLLMVGTIIYMPIMLPVLLPGVSVNPADIALSLVVLMLIPLGVALFVAGALQEIADWLRPKMAQLSNVGLIGLITTMLLLDWRNVLQTIGTGALASIILFDRHRRRDWVPFGRRCARWESQSWHWARRSAIWRRRMWWRWATLPRSPNVLVTVIVAGVLMMVILFPLAGEFGKRAPAPKGVPVTAPAAAAPAKSGGGSGKKK